MKSRNRNVKNDFCWCFFLLHLRFVLNLHCIFEKSFSGMLIYENPMYVAPNFQRQMVKAAASEKYKQRVQQKLSYEQKKPEESFPFDKTDEIFQTPAPPETDEDEA